MLHPVVATPWLKFETLNDDSFVFGILFEIEKVFAAIQCYNHETLFETFRCLEMQLIS